MPGSLPTENLPQKSIPSTIQNTKPRQSAEIIEQKRIENPIAVQDSHVPCYSSFDDFNKKIANLKLNSYQVLKFSSYKKYLN